MQLVGLDIGTTSVGGVLIDGDSGEVIDSAVLEHRAGLDTTQEWERVQDPETLLAAVRAVLERLTASPGVRGLGVTGQMHDILYIDRAGRAVSPLITWQDQRGDLICRNGKSYVQILTESTAHSLATGFGLVTHYYNLHNGLVPTAAVRSRRSYLVGCGNGLRFNQTLCKVMADRFSLPLRIPVHREEAAFGAALCAGVGLGLYRDFLAAGRVIRYL